MNGNAKLVVMILAVALGLGVLADSLLRVGPWGLNATIWVAVLALAVAVLPSRDGMRLSAGRTAFLPLVLVFGGCLAWRDSSTLKMLAVLTLGCVFLICVLPSRVSQLRKIALTHAVMGGLDAGRNVVIGLLALIGHDVSFKNLFEGTDEKANDGFWRRHAAAVFKGVLLTVPLLLVFGGLFVSADPAFKAIVNDLFNGKLFDLDWETLGEHLFVLSFYTWFSAGYLRLLVLKTEGDWPKESEFKNYSLNAVTLAVPLLSLDLLFLAFVGVQSRYMFGGEQLVRSRTGLTYATYAREGFFQLVVVAALALVFLLALDWLGRNETRTGRRVLRVTSGALVALVYVVLASAMFRMRLYQEVYGFTELRVYTTAFMLWLAVVFFWFLATVLRGRRERFALGTVLAGMAIVFCLHLFNPDAYIARSNFNRIAEGKSFDAKYAAALSADAIPVLVDAIPSLKAPARDEITSRLNEWAERDRQSDWRTWSWARHQAGVATAKLK